MALKKLVPLSKSMAKRLGVVETKTGLMFDTSKLTVKKKYQSKVTVSERPDKPKPKEKADKADEAKGLY